MYCLLSHWFWVTQAWSFVRSPVAGPVSHASEPLSETVVCFCLADRPLWKNPHHISSCTPLIHATRNIHYTVCDVPDTACQYDTTHTTCNETHAYGLWYSKHIMLTMYHVTCHIHGTVFHTVNNMWYTSRTAYTTIKLCLQYAAYNTCYMRNAYGNMCAHLYTYHTP